MGSTGCFLVDRPLEATEVPSAPEGGDKLYLAAVNMALTASPMTTAHGNGNFFCDKLFNAVTNSAVYGTESRNDQNGVLEGYSVFCAHEHLWGCLRGHRNEQTILHRRPNLNGRNSY